jgi:ribosomal protein S18 acetylase RimI-like enzyme
LLKFRIRPAELEDLSRCLDIDAGYVTRHVWQMQESFEEPPELDEEELALARSRNQILGKTISVNLPIFQMNLSPSRLPRPLAVAAPLNDQQLLGEWKKTDLLLVAETVDLEPHQAILMGEGPDLDLDPSLDEEGQPVMYRPAPPDILGYIGLSVDTTRHVAWITTHAVQLDFRRQGVGHQLLSEARAWADRHRLRSLLVELEIKNYPAINYFQKNGFFFCGYNNAYYATREIALFFGKRLEKFS